MNTRNVLATGLLALTIAGCNNEPRSRARVGGHEGSYEVYGCASDEAKRPCVHIVTANKGWEFADHAHGYRNSDGSWRILGQPYNHEKGKPGRYCEDPADPFKPTGYVPCSTAFVNEMTLVLNKAYDIVRK